MTDPSGLRARIVAHLHSDVEMSAVTRALLKEALEEIAFLRTNGAGAISRGESFEDIAERARTSPRTRSDT